MKHLDKELLTTRRNFLRQSACASLGFTGLVNTLAHLKLVNAALAQAGPLADYKALVVLFLFGGNDSNNMLLPRRGHPAYADYKSARSILGILDQTDPDYVSGAPASIPLTTDSGPYGVHPGMQEVAGLFNTGQLGFVANVGTLAFPVTRDEYIAGAVPVPPQLFSHADQQVQWQSSLPDRPFTAGWGGRAADLLHAGGYSSGQVSMSVTISGINSLQVGNNVVQYSVTPEGAISLDGFAAGGQPYGAALNPDGSYQTTTEGTRLKAFEDIMRYTHQHLLEEGYNEVVRRARANEALIGAAFTAAAASGIDFDAQFVNAQTNLGDQMKTIAKLIAGRETLGNRRQIFFCSAGGFDTHQDQLEAHSNLMIELSTSLKAFRDTLVALGVHQNVLTMTHSDFTRTLTPNGTDPTSSGSDHGWGGHHIVMGGGVSGGKIYGTFPSLKVGGDQDVDRNRGRWIPTTAVDQYAAVAAKWLGVESSALGTIFPNLGRFADPFLPSTNLTYIA
jgi:uncharacterized protein (DUF1501 family)